MYENFFPCINPKMMRDNEKISPNNIYDNPQKNNIEINNNNINNVMGDSSGCGSNPLNLELARAYMPIQPYVGILPLQEGLKRGSIFPNINLKYPRL